MSLPIVRTFFEQKVQTFADSRSMPVSWQNRPISKPVNTLWIECFLTPNRTFNRDVSGEGYTDIGLFQINVWIPAGKSMVAGETLIEDLRALFPIVPKGIVSVEQTPSVGRALTDATGWVIVPILISYRYEA